MNRAWKKIQLSQEFNVTVDLFRFGLAFRRSHQQRALYSKIVCQWFLELFFNANSSCSSL